MEIFYICKGITFNLKIIQYYLSQVAMQLWDFSHNFFSIYRLKFLPRCHQVNGRNSLISNWSSFQILFVTTLGRSKKLNNSQILISFQNLHQPTFLTFVLWLPPSSITRRVQHSTHNAPRRDFQSRMIKCRGRWVTTFRALVPNVAAFSAGHVFFACTDYAFTRAFQRIHFFVLSFVVLSPFVAVSKLCILF